MSRTDTERLEWLIEGPGREFCIRVQGNHQRGWVALDCSDGLVFASDQNCKTFREALDQAIEYVERKKAARQARRGTP